MKRSHTGLAAPILTFSLLSVLVCPAFSLQDIQEQSLDEKQLEVSLEERKENEPFAVKRFNLGSVELDRPCLIKFVLKNEGSAPVEFRKVEGSCSCLDIRVREGKIEPGSSVTVEAVLDIHKRETSAIAQLDLQFYESKDDKRSFLHLRAMANLKGVVEFGIQQPMIELDNFGLSTVRLPLLITDPVDPHSLIIEKSDTFRDLMPKVEVVDGRSELVVEVVDILIPDSFISGWFKIRDPVTGREDLEEFLIQKRKPFSLSPRIARLAVKDVKAGEEPARTFSGFLKVHACSPSGADSAGTTQPSSVGIPSLSRLEATIDSQPVTLTLVKLGDDLYRFSGQIPDASLSEKSDGEIDWTVALGENHHSLTTSWRIPK